MSEAFFVDRLTLHAHQPALITDSGAQFTYAQLASAVDLTAAELRDAEGLVIVEANNNVPCIVAYLACMRARRPVLLVEPGSTRRDSRIAERFAATLIFRELQPSDWRFESLGAGNSPAVHPNLCVLLSTSGTTGSPKLVRLSRQNIEANAGAIASYLSISPSEKAITTLPPFYSFGMSVINSHLHAGATLLLTEQSVATDEFWQFFKTQGATSFSGVPFTFDVLERIGFRNRQYPTLRYIAQAGGRLPEQRVRAYAEWATSAGKEMFVMYGQTEASPRMAYVPSALLAEHPDCIGIAVPGGEFVLVDGTGAAISGTDQPGELVYKGPNVMMGYAESGADLAAGPGPATLHTGDLASRNQTGLYYIVGRKTRFSKIVGLRISLDEVEQWLARQGAVGIVSGDDVLIVVALTEAPDCAVIKRQLLERFALPASALYVKQFDAIPVLPSGKFDYRTILQIGHAEVSGSTAPASLLQAYRDILGMNDIRAADSFVELGGDSINFVEVSIAIETYLGFLPENWEAMPISALEDKKFAPSEGAPPVQRPTHSRNFWVSVALFFVALVGVEILLQARSYLKTGRSALALATGESTMVRNPDSGVKTYRPNLVVDNYGGPGGRFETNSAGFRSKEIAPQPAAGELRIVVAGASTVAGAYAKTNAVTFPSILEAKLRRTFPLQTINVVNAGVEGYTLEDVERLIDRSLIRLAPSMVIVYPGFNDIARLCRAGKDAAPAMPLRAPALPDWILTRDLISKNTIAVREPPIRAVTVKPRAHPPVKYEQTLERIVARLTTAGIQPVFVTVARAFTGADRASGMKLAESALFFNYCLDYDGLVEAGEMYNEAILRVAKLRHVPVVDLAKTMPGGKEYFVDAGHFTLRGEQFAAHSLHHFLAAAGSTSLRNVAAQKTTEGR